MGFDPISIGIMVASAAASAAAQRQSAQAQEDAAEYEADLLNQKAANDTDARIENTRRKQEDADRHLSRVKVIQANSGVVSTEGTANLVFEEIESRLDEEINDFSKAALTSIGRTEDAAKQALWQGKTNANSTRLAAAGTLIKGGVKAGAAAFDLWGPSTTTAQDNRPRPYSLF